MTTRILFCHGADDRLQAAAAWLRLQLAQTTPASPSRSTLVYGDDPGLLAQLDQLLWAVPATSFTPHCPMDSPLATRTPIVLSTRTTPLVDGLNPACLVNLSQHLPEQYHRYPLLVEIVDRNEATRQLARERARHYKDQGLILDYRDLASEPL